ncbi:uncharacterized protein LOC128195196 [Vigna angularis]|uniref:uncharacterized protein LOC128195196 n=1 Tax=Phaseolus angularis TaxID=3914 RepID=UPI0022B3D7AF|nr:uncharacterized protein LOC128195196 [Vigna angularis]
MDESETVAEYFDKVQELVNAMRACKDDITNQLVAKGFLQKAEVDYGELFAHVARCELISNFKPQMLKEFEISGLGRLSYFLGIKFIETGCEIVMHQSMYVLDLLKRFDMLNFNAANTQAELGLRLEKEPEEEAVDPTTYRKIIGSLRYLCNTRPDLCKAKYIAACEATCQASWLVSLMEGLKVELAGKVRLFVDNKSTIDLAKHATSHGRSKHMETIFH